MPNFVYKNKKQLRVNKQWMKEWIKEKIFIASNKAKLFDLLPEIDCNLTSFLLILFADHLWKFIDWSIYFHLGFLKNSSIPLQSMFSICY